MTDKPVVYWGCPLCGLEQFIYGKTCPKFKDRSCKHIDQIHITGQFYLKEINTNSESIGIAAISNEV